ncbi:MAG: ABC transporter ATP-binding protein [Bacteroidetes bacterium HGW-Bacteroidetes-4]|nr:MAG: ABC transporter ATP-binding protein [Bacteroidetes bacterium HGW-Bacteroidetes-4]
MSDIAIKVAYLSKKYTIGRGQSGSLRETLSGLWHNTFGGQRTDEEAFWALRDVSFEIKQGEAVGIIGRNGAGKSTLLKLLSKITYPTSGKITMNGRVSSLLEVGTGFHPELTGRENIYLNGTILGMSRREVKTKFDEIVAFSGVEKFLDTPVKRYSSGMYVRLAFAVAAHLEPEILIIDEVLAVGDAEFQKKCLGKMDEVAKGGRTVIFVSHNLGAVEQLCNKGIILKDGQVNYLGNTLDTINHYLNNIVRQDTINYKANSNGENCVLEATVLDIQKKPKQTFTNSEEIVLKVQFNVQNLSNCLGLALKDIKGNKITTKVLDNIKQIGNQTAILTIPKEFLLNGSYFIDLAVFIKNGIVFEYLDSICSFDIVDVNSDMAIYGGTNTGVVNLKATWELL